MRFWSSKAAFSGVREPANSVARQARQIPGASGSAPSP